MLTHLPHTPRPQPSTARTTQCGSLENHCFGATWTRAGSATWQLWRIVRSLSAGLPLSRRGGSLRSRSLPQARPTPPPPPEGGPPHMCLQSPVCFLGASGIRRGLKHETQWVLVGAQCRSQTASIIIQNALSRRWRSLLPPGSLRQALRRSRGTLPPREPSSSQAVGSSTSADRFSGDPVGWFDSSSPPHLPGAQLQLTRHYYFLED